MKRSDIGRRGEEAAAQYLAANGYEIIARNYRAGHLETDIICRRDGRTAFVEVKTRTPASAKYGRPAAAVDKRKSERLVACAEAYIREMRARGEDVPRPRIDVIEVFFSGAECKITHLQNAVMKEENT
ncbi:MAG: YraN family protein [Clostridia bacterium]|nr:YraN family protein [Clostridia bacterium]